MFGKEAYKPADRRFEVSKDDLSRERLKAVKGACEAVQDAIPEIRLAFSLFGSLSKGKVLRNTNILKLQLGNAGRTDIDLACFYDDDDAKINIPISEKKLTATSLLDSISSLDLDSPAVQSFMQEATEVVPAMRDLIGDGTPETEDSIKLFKIMHPRVASIIRDNLKDRLGKRIQAQIPTLPITLDGPQSILSHVQKVCSFSGEDEDGLKKHVHSLYIAMCFGMDLGGGLKRYRQDFLSKLSRLDPDIAEQYWRVVDESVRQYERESTIPLRAEKQYPSTFAKAIEYYGLPSAPQPAV